MLRIPRLPWDKFFMLHAHLAATRSTCDRGPELMLDPGRHGVGAVIVKNSRIIAGGYNGSPPGQPHCNDPEEFLECRVCKGRTPKYEGTNICDCGSGPTMEKRVGGHWLVDGHCIRTIHAEMNALIQCALDGASPEGGTLFTTASPCYDCAKMLIRSGLSKVCVGQAYDSRYGMSGKVRHFLNSSGIEYYAIEMCQDDFLSKEP